MLPWLSRFVSDKVRSVAEVFPKPPVRRSPSPFSVHARPVLRPDKQRTLSDSSAGTVNGITAGFVGHTSMFHIFQFATQIGRAPDGVNLIGGVVQVQILASPLAHIVISSHRA